MAGAAATALELAISGTVPLGTVLPAMLGMHALIGVGEAVITVAAVSAVLATRPDLLGVAPRPPAASPEPADAPVHDPRPRARHRARHRRLAVRLAAARTGSRRSPPTRPSSTTAAAPLQETRRSPTTPSRASRTSASPPASPASPARCSCSRSATGSPRSRGRRAASRMSGGHLHAAGVAGDPGSPIHRLDPRAKLIGLAGVTLVAVSTPLRAWPAYVACALALAPSPRSPACGPRTLWTRAGSCSRSCCSSRSSCRSCASGDPVDLGPFTVSEEGLATFATVSAKAILGTLSAVLLGATTSFPDVLHALERLRAPRLLVLIAAFMYRYLFVIVEEVAAHARRARRPRLRAAPRAAGAGHRPRRHRAVPAHLRARRARAPGDARARLEPGDAAPGRARLPPRGRALPRRARRAAARRSG